MSLLKIISFILFIVGGLTLFKYTDLDLSNLKTWIITIGLCLSGFLTGIDINFNSVLKKILVEGVEQDKDE